MSKRYYAEKLVPHSWVPVSAFDNVIAKPKCLICGHKVPHSLFCGDSLKPGVDPRWVDVAKDWVRYNSPDDTKEAVSKMVSHYIRRHKKADLKEMLVSILMQTP